MFSNINDFFFFFLEFGSDYAYLKIQDPFRNFTGFAFSQKQTTLENVRGENL